jgi:hypothetical protein
MNEMPWRSDTSLEPPFLTTRHPAVLFLLPGISEPNAAYFRPYLHPQDLLFEPARPPVGIH